MREPAFHAEQHWVIESAFACHGARLQRRCTAPARESAEQPVMASASAWLDLCMLYRPKLECIVLSTSCRGSFFGCTPKWPPGYRGSCGTERFAFASSYCGKGIPP